MKKNRWKLIITGVVGLSVIACMLAYTNAKKGSINSIEEDLEKYVASVDKDFAWEVTETLSYDEKYWDDSTGFRTAGSDAEHRAADYLADTFKEIGLEEVEKEAVHLDKWQFNGAEFTLKNEASQVDLKINPVSYASSGTDAEGITGEVIYMNHGYESDYEAYYDAKGLVGEDRNVEGKIILIDINQNEEYWITPHYLEAYYQGAAGLISYSSQYTDENGNQRGDEWDVACQMQDLNARDLKLPCVSISRADGLEIKESIEKMQVQGQVSTANLVVDNEILEDEGVSYNVVGKIKGSGNTGQQILVAGHYDKYFYGTNDDCAAIGLIAAMAKAMVDSEYTPVNDIIFIAHGAEEWGQTGIETDWAEGAWQMITKNHPEWQGTTLALLNYELPAMKGEGKDLALLNQDLSETKEQETGLKAVVRSTEETFTIQKDLANLSGLLSKIDKEAEIEHTYGSSVISDEISYQFMGVPSFGIRVFERTEGHALNSYHTQFDNKEEYSHEAMDYNLQLSGALAMYVDQLPALKLDFNLRCDEIENAIKDYEALYEEVGIQTNAYNEALQALRAAGEAFTKKADEINKAYEKAVASGKDTSAIMEEAITFNKQGLTAYRYLQDTFLGMGGDGDVYLFHEIVQDNIAVLDAVIENLEKGDMDTVLEKAYAINGGIEYTAYSFSNQTSEELLKSSFCEYVTDNRAYGKKIARVDVYEATHAIITGTNSEAFKEELALYKAERDRLLPLLEQYIDQEIKGMDELTNRLFVK